MCLLRRFFLLVFLSVFSSLSFASVGKLVLVTGKVEVERANQMLGVKTGDSIYKSDHIYTRSNSSAQVKFTDDTAITLGANTDLKVQEVLLDGKKSEASFSVGRGGFKTITGKIGKLNPDRFKLHTPTSTIGIRGTIFAGKIEADKETFATLRGRIYITLNETSELINLPEGKLVNIFRDNTSEPVQDITSEDLNELSNNTNSPANEASTSEIAESEEVFVDSMQESLAVVQTENTNLAQNNSSVEIISSEDFAEENLQQVALAELDEQVIDRAPVEPEPVEPEPVEPEPVEPEPVEPKPSTPKPSNPGSGNSGSGNPGSGEQEAEISVTGQKVGGGYEFGEISQDLKASDFDEFNGYIGWGKWDATENEPDIYFVAGIDADKAAIHIQSLIDDEAKTPYTYKGGFLGIYTQNPQGGVVEDFDITDSSLNLTFNFDSPNQAMYEGNGFITAGSIAHIEFDIDGGFDGYDASSPIEFSIASVNGVPTSSPEMYGNFYGDQAQSIGGHITIGDGNGVAYGVFKATR